MINVQNIYKSKEQYQCKKKHTGWICIDTKIVVERSWYRKVTHGHSIVINENNVCATLDNTNNHTRNKKYCKSDKFQ